ncbi:hypothetical protein HPP92_001462 [Vanilla planifolia]|uniref:Chloroplast lumen common family protein n=1 Tax=Vanilla planifolia TaxID=51239 RepID=A0A835RY77_VANPL|nr:hypothetical protein HPP92_001462 [Vanilla planifolia]
MESSCRAFHTPRSLCTFPSAASPASVPKILPYRPFLNQKPLRPLRFSSKFPSIRSSSKPSPIGSSDKPICHDTRNPNVGSFPTIFAAAAAAAAALLFTRFNVPPRAVAAVFSEAPPAASMGSIDYDQALTDEEKERVLENKLESCPEDNSSLRSLMDLKIKAGKYQDAIAAIDRLIQLEPGEKDLLLLKAHIQSYTGDVEAAKLGFEALLAEDPFCVEAYHGLVMVQREVDGELDVVLKRIESALETCKKLKRVEDVRDFKLLVAQVKVISDEYEAALKIYQELVREEPKDFRPYLCQGITYTLMRKNEEAEKQFDKYRRLVPREHPYSEFFDDSMIAMKVFSQMEANKTKTSLKV